MNVDVLIEVNFRRTTRKRNDAFGVSGAAAQLDWRKAAMCLRSAAAQDGGNKQKKNRVVCFFRRRLWGHVQHEEPLPVSRGDPPLFLGGVVADCSDVGLIHQCHVRSCEKTTQTHTHTHEKDYSLDIKSANLTVWV